MQLPIAQYPRITLPTIVVSATYPGANAETVVQSVAQPIEAQVNGVEGMLYMESTSSSAGTYRLSVTFGLELRVFQFNFWDRPRRGRISLTSDIAESYRNGGLSIGFWH